jgi:ABC-type multidrug transport system fused ATPase/permease subunit
VWALQIQAVVRDELAEATVVTIAHRLKTTIGLDRIVVLDEGQIIEFDTPQALLQNPTR